MALPMRVPIEPPVPWASAMSQLGTWTAGCASPRSWRTASMTLVIATAVGGMVVAQAAAVGVEREPAVGRPQRPVEHEPPTLALLAEAEVFERLQDRDGEGVVDRRVVDVRRSDAGLGEGPGSGRSGAGAGQVDAPERRCV